MLSEKLLTGLIEQFNSNLYASHLYLCIAAYFDSENLEGFSNLFIKQSKEEIENALELFKYISSMGEKVIVNDMPQNNFIPTSPLKAFEKTCKHESYATSTFYTLANSAIEEKEHTTINFLETLICKQAIKENRFSKILRKLSIIENNISALHVLDSELLKMTSVK